jgi:AraC family transcriptional regulator, transcriptional activator of the genes for pyochelin and ferripyochelin receptors
MDKINSAHWSDVFGRTQQHLVFASDRYSDVHFQFEEPGLASGFIQSVSTPGMRLTEFSMSAGKPFQLVDNEINETAESVFVLNGGAQSNFHNMHSSLQFGKNHHNFQYNKHFGGEHVIDAGGFHALTITYEMDFLQQLFQTDDNSVLGQLANSVQAKKTYVASAKTLQCNGRIAEVIANIKQCPFTGVTRYLFLESKMMELFVLQMQQVQAMMDRKDEDDWSGEDRDKLHVLKHFIENAYLDEFSLKELTYKFALNEFKLKKGYKQFFGTTVFGHVHQLRMKKAKMLLEEKTMTVSEVSFFIGYNNVSSFSTEFKKRFGYSPGKINVN